MTNLQALNDLISEEEVYKQFKHLFADKELRDARQTGELEFYKLRKGIFYTEDQLLAYLEQRKQKPCANRPLSLAENESNPASGNSETNGSARRPRLRAITATGTSETRTAQDDELVAKALERQI